MTNTLRVAAVLASALAAAASATQSRGTSSCRPGQYVSGSECIDPPVYVPFPELRRVHVVEVEKPVDGFEISAKPYGAAGWEIAVKNTTETVVTVLWDESSFVASTGMAAGRLINGNVRKIDTAKAQPGTPIPPGAAVREVVFPEKFIGAEEEEQSAATLGSRGVEQRVVERMKLAREERYKLIVGGKLYVTVQRSSEKQTWSGAVKMPASEPAEPSK